MLLARLFAMGVLTAGVSAMTYGASMFSPAAGWIVGGLCACMFARAMFDVMEENGGEDLS